MELRPVLATKSGDIYAGNMRYRAAEHLGWKEIPAIITDIDDTLAKERAVKDNNQFGEWDDTLSTLLDELEKEGVDLDTLGLDESIASAIDSLVPAFAPATLEEQGRLDEKKPILCPNCKYEFTT